MIAISTPRDQVGDHRAAGEADDQPEHGGRGEDPGGEALDLGELAQRQRDPDQDDRHEDEPADQPQAGPGLAGELSGLELLRRALSARPSRKRSTSDRDAAIATTIVIAAETSSPWLSQKVWIRGGRHGGGVSHRA